MKSFQIFNSVKDATILAADTSGLLKDAKVKVSFEFVQYPRNGVFVVVEDLPNWVQNTSTGKYIRQLSLWWWTTRIPDILRGRGCVNWL